MPAQRSGLAPRGPRAVVPTLLLGLMLLACGETTPPTDAPSDLDPPDAAALPDPDPVPDPDHDPDIEPDIEPDPEREPEREPGAEPGRDPEPEPEPGGDLDAADADRGPPSVVAWILSLGPRAPSGPSAFRAYALLERGDCAGILDRLDADHREALQLGQPSEDLYRAAALACLAGLDGRSELWGEARDIAARAGDGSGSCLDLATRVTLDALLAAGQADPNVRVEPSAGADGVAPACPELTGLVTDHSDGTTTIRVEGRHLDAVVDVELRQRDATGDGDRGSFVAGLDAGSLADARIAANAFLLQVPGGLPPGEYCVLLRAIPDWDADGAALTVQVDPSGGGGDGDDEAATSDGAETSSPCPPPASAS
jgi:hypothetical protein